METQRGAGDNKEDLRSRAARLSQVLDDIAELQEEAKQIKAEAKADGFNVKVLGQIVKELRRGAEYQADQLQLELEIDTYRAAVGLPTDLSDAQARALEAASELPAADDTDPDVFGEGDTVQIGDAPPIPAREFARAAKRPKRGGRL